MRRLHFCRKHAYGCKCRMVPHVEFRRLAVNASSLCDFALCERGLWFVEVVVLIVFCALQGQLEGKAILGDLVDPYIGSNFDRP